ncbi:hypothetical protein ABEB36_005784 [Hypothenemus hampei]|uniref:Stathmin n=1 Tax=Hypothenemus hampei TaxID=57062 RepID=A0ABD1EZF5_HYPHA
MGCNAAKNVTVSPIDDQTRNRKSRQSFTRNGIDLEPGQIDNATVNNVQKAEHGMSFDIIFDDNNEDNERKEPPKRILESKESKSNLTLEKLQEKLDEAEDRRQQILQQRVQSAKKSRQT